MTEERRRHRSHSPAHRRYHRLGHGQIEFTLYAESRCSVRDRVGSEVMAVALETGDAKEKAVGCRTRRSES